MLNSTFYFIRIGQFMDTLIPVINKLQNALSMTDIGCIDLPQIIVVGSQSSGKSSVLECLVGKDFLPRGSGIITRRPLILQLVNTKTDNNLEWGEFLHKKEKFYDFNLIKEEIIKETERITGKNKQISSTPINLTIYSPNVLNLTLIDLPGLTKVPVGDQPKNIETQIRNMVLQFISNPKAIILAISAANVDIANSDALKVARDVDPHGQRTIGVLTKLDLMDKGTDAMDILLGNVYPLRLGFIGVVNRSQEDINANITIQESLEKEKAFFESHPKYSLIKNKCGYPYLANTLNNLLMNHVRECLPDLKRQLKLKLNSAYASLNELGDPHLNQSKNALLLHIINQFCDLYRSHIDGTLPDDASKDLYGGARISNEFIVKFGRQIDYFEPNISDEQIKIAISNSIGTKAPLFVPENAFELFIKDLIQSLEELCLKCSDMIFEELKNITENIDVPELRHFLVLRERIIEVVINLLIECQTPVKDMITTMIGIEKGYINTNHPDFLKDKAKWREKILKHHIDSTPQKIKSPDTNVKMEYPPNIIDNPIFNDNTLLELLREMIYSYFSIVKKNIKDRVPKIIMHFMVNESKHRIQSELIKKLYKEELFEILLKETDEITEKRNKHLNMIALFTKAQNILKEV